MPRRICIRRICRSSSFATEPRIGSDTLATKLCWSYIDSRLPLLRWRSPIETATGGSFSDDRPEDSIADVVEPLQIILGLVRGDDLAGEDRVISGLHVDLHDALEVGNTA